MKTLKVSIDCGDKFCGKCESMNEDFDVGLVRLIYYCRIFDVDLDLDGKNADSPLRCQDCLDSEVDR